MQAILLEGPRTEPLSISEARAWLRIETTDEDGLIAGLVSAAREYVEARTGILMHQTWRLRFDMPFSGAIVPNRLRPVQGIIAARAICPDGDVTLGPGVLQRSGDDALMLAPQFTLPPSALAVEADLRCGRASEAGALAPVLRHALRVVVAHWHAHRGDGGEDISAPPGLAEMLRPYARRRLA